MSEDQIDYTIKHIREGIDGDDFMDGRTCNVNGIDGCICRKINNGYFLFKCDNLNEYIDCNETPIQSIKLEWNGPDLQQYDEKVIDEFIKSSLEEKIAEWIRKIPRKKKAKKFI
jgi:hypothetical protein